MSSLNNRFSYFKENYLSYEELYYINILVCYGYIFNTNVRLTSSIVVYILCLFSLLEDHEVE